MESTGKYWIPVYNILEPNCQIVLAYPKYVKAIRGKKTDKRDAKWIADIFKHDLVSGSFIPPADIRQLRDLFRYRCKLTNFTTDEKTGHRTALLSPISNWTISFPMSLVKQPPQSRLACWKIQPEKSQMFLVFAPEA